MAEQIMRKHYRERLGRVNNFEEMPPLPRSLTLELNNTCNQKCIFCSYHSEYAPQQHKAAIIPYEKVIEILDESKRLGIGEKEVGFCVSGEVFLYKDLAKVIKHAKKLGFQYTFITSNGSIATPERMKELIDAGIDSIRISINAADRETYMKIHGRDDFDKVCDNVRFMHEYIRNNSLKVATSISCVLTKKTAHIQEEVKKLFGQYVDDIMFIPVILNRMGDLPEFKEEYQIVDDSRMEINQNFVCPVLFDAMYIDANMHVVPCCDACFGDCCFYDLNENMDLEKAWLSEGYKRYRNIFLKGEDDKGTICEDCVLRMHGVQRMEM